MTDKEAVAKAVASLERTAKALNDLGPTIMVEAGLVAPQRLDEFAARLRWEAEELRAHLVEQARSFPG